MPFSATGNLIHILRASPGVAAKKCLLVVDIIGRFNSLYLYTGLVEHQLVRDFVVPLFLCVLTARNNKIMPGTYDKPQKVLVNLQHIDTISIDKD